MDILDSALSREIEKIFDGGAKGVFYYWRAIIHTPKEKVDAMKLLSIDTMRDYENKYADETIIRLILGGGAYSYRVYPYLDQLEISLFRIPLLENSDGQDEERLVQVTRYVATSLNPTSPIVTASGVNQPDEVALDLTNILELDFQLTPKSVDQMRMITVGNIFRDVTVEKALRAVYTEESKKVEVDAEEMPLGVDMIPAKNTKVRDHIVIPQGTKLVDVGRHIHYRCGGVYGTGFACYYQDRHWYIFPPYDNTVWNTADEFLTIIRVPKDRFPEVERTFRKDGKNLTIIASGDATLSNDSEEMYLNQGNGLRFGDADLFMEDFVKTKGNKTVASRGANNNEVVSSQRDNGRNIVYQSNTPITSNSLVEFSKLAAKDGNIAEVVWENSDPTLIWPGQPVKYQYLDGEELKEMLGVVIKAHHYTTTEGVGITASRHVSKSSLVLFIK